MVKRELPGVALEIRADMLTPDQCDGLRAGALDLGVLRPPAVGEDIEMRTIDLETLVLAVSVDHRLAVEPVVSLTDLRSEPFISYASRDSAVNDAVLRSCRRAGFVPRREHTAPGTAVLLALVAAGLGVAVVPESVRALPLRRRGVPRSGGRRIHRARPGLASRRREPARDRRRGRAVICPLEGGIVKITAVEAIPFAIPYVKPLKFASGEVHVAEHVLVRVHTDDGVVGVAEAPPRPFTYGETQAGIIAVINGVFIPQLVGLTLTEREVVNARLSRTVGNPTAKAAIDMAIWDALGRTLQLPVSDLLGGFSDRMRVSPHAGFRRAARRWWPRPRKCLTCTAFRRSR